MKKYKKAAIVDFDLVDKLRAYLDDTTILEELIRALDTDTTKDCLEYIARNYEIPLDENEDEVEAKKAGRLQKLAYNADSLEEIYDDVVYAIHNYEDLYAELDNGEINEWAYRVQVTKDEVTLIVYKYVDDDEEDRTITNYTNMPINEFPESFVEFKHLLNELCYYAY